MLDGTFKHEFNCRAKEVEETIVYQKCVGIRNKQVGNRGFVIAAIL